MSVEFNEVASQIEQNWLVISVVITTGTPKLKSSVGNLHEVFLPLILNKFFAVLVKVKLHALLFIMSFGIETLYNVSGYIKLFNACRNYRQNRCCTDTENPMEEQRTTVWQTLKMIKEG